MVNQKSDEAFLSRMAVGSERSLLLSAEDQQIGSRPCFPAPSSEYLKPKQMCHPEAAFFAADRRFWPCRKEPKPPEFAGMLM